MKWTNKHGTFMIRRQGKNGSGRTWINFKTLEQRPTYHQYSTFEPQNIMSKKIRYIH